jgi:phosphatidylserine decarboxylase
MDPFVVTSLGKKTYRTRVVRHNLNPVFEEKLVFQVMRHEVNYSVNFAVVDRDKLSGNDFVGTTNLSLDQLTQIAPDVDPATGLYTLPEPPDPASPPPPDPRRSRFRIPMSRSSSATSVHRVKPGLKKESSSSSLSNYQSGERTPPLPVAPTSVPSASPTLPSYDSNGSQGSKSNHGSQASQSNLPQISIDPTVTDEGDMKSYALKLDLKNKDRWETKHTPTLYIKARYLPYQALRQQFWRAMLKQYDADESGKIDKVELTTMLDSLGSTLHQSTIDGFFARFAAENNGEECLTFDQAVICLEDQLIQSTQQQKPWRAFRHGLSTPSGETSTTPGSMTPSLYSGSNTPLNNRSELSVIPAIEQDTIGKEGEEGAMLEKDDLADEKGEEHVIEIRECPICHQPRLNKRTDADIITHIATCASQDWRQVNNIVMAGFVTSSQAQRKWYSKVITKISYGGYKLGANSANILVQDRLTGQINEERMSVYVRLGIRLLYKGLKSRDMERKKSEFLLVVSVE